MFGGICVLCNGRVRFLLKRDCGRYRFVAMQSQRAQAVVAHGLDADDPASFLLSRSL